MHIHHINGKEKIEYISEFLKSKGFCILSTKKNSLTLHVYRKTNE